MQSDSSTRVLLALILVCLLVLVGQGTGLIPRAGHDDGQAAARYTMMVLPQKRGGSLAVRVDTVTGTVWRKDLEGEGPWVIVDRETRDAAAAAMGLEPSEEPPAAGLAPVSVPIPPPTPGAPKPVADAAVADTAVGETAPADAVSDGGPAIGDLPDSVAALVADAVPSPARRAQKGLYRALAPEAKARGIDVRPRQDLSALVAMARTAPEPVLQEIAVEQIAAYPPRSSVPALVELLDHPSTSVVRKVARSLKKAGDPSAIAPLREVAANHKSGKVRRVAELAIEKLENPTGSKADTSSDSTAGAASHTDTDTD